MPTLALPACLRLQEFYEAQTVPTDYIDMYVRPDGTRVIEMTVARE
jgi:hypothetical protein